MVIVAYCLVRSLKLRSFDVSIINRTFLSFINHRGREIPCLMQISRRTFGRRNRKQCGKMKSSIASYISQLHAYNVSFFHCVNSHKNTKEVLMLWFYRCFIAIAKLLLVVHNDMCHKKLQINQLFPSGCSTLIFKEPNLRLWHMNVSLCNLSMG